MAQYCGDEVNEYQAFQGDEGFYLRLSVTSCAENGWRKHYSLYFTNEHDLCAWLIKHFKVNKRKLCGL